MSKYHLIYRVSRIEDGPQEFHDAMPVYGRIFDKLEHQDGSEYYLSELLSPIQSKGRTIRYAVIGARFEGSAIGPNMTDLPINAAYVTDESLLEERHMDFDKGEFMGIAEVTDVTTEFNQAMKNSENQETNKKPWWKFWKSA